MNEFDFNKIAELNSDPQLDGMPNDALAAEEVPAGLKQRILDATEDRLPTDAPARGGVIGFIGGGLPWRSVAAVVVLGTVIGGLLMINPDRASDPTPGDSTTVTQHTPAANPLPHVQAGLDQLADAEFRDELIDDRIELLSMQVSWAQAEDFWADDAMDSLDSAIALDELDLLAEEMEYYF